MRGALIVVEGLDRAGKSTQCERLCQRLKREGRPVKRLRFPSKPLHYRYSNAKTNILSHARPIHTHRGMH